MGSLRDHFGTTLGPLWDHFGTTLGPLCDHFGTTLGPLWDHIRTILGPLWNHFGTNLGPILNHFGTTLGPFRDNFGTIMRTIFGPFWDPSYFALLLLKRGPKAPKRARRAPQPSAGARRKGAERPELLVLDILNIHRSQHN